jgi:hypothetical protein
MIEVLGPSRGLFVGKTEIRDLELYQISIPVKRINGSSVPPRFNIHAMRRTVNG